MTLLSRRPSVSELSEQILDMARTGVYRASVLEALQPIATQKDIRRAIAHAKRFGLHSVASLRDGDLGTYYQLDVQKYEALRSRLHSPLLLGKDAELVDRVTLATVASERMLSVVKRCTFGLVATALLCGVAGWKQASFGLFCSALSAFGIWTLQKVLAPAASSSKS